LIRYSNFLYIVICKRYAFEDSFTFDTNEQLNNYKESVEGVFTNRADFALEFYNRKSDTSPQDILIKLGYN